MNALYRWTISAVVLGSLAAAVGVCWMVDNAARTFHRPNKAGPAKERGR